MYCLVLTSTQTPFQHVLIVLNQPGIISIKDFKILKNIFQHFKSNKISEVAVDWTGLFIWLCYPVYQAVFVLMQFLMFTQLDL